MDALGEGGLVFPIGSRTQVHASNNVSILRQMHDYRTRVLLYQKLGIAVSVPVGQEDHEYPGGSARQILGIGFTSSSGFFLLESSLKCLR